MTPRHAASTASIAAALAMIVLAVPAWAKTTDRNQPMNVESGSQQGATDDSAPTVFKGNVHITQGSLDIRSRDAVVTMKNGEASRVVFTGAPVVMKQQMDDGSPVTARGNNVDYDMTTETIVFTGDAYVESPRGNTRGPKITYNMKTGRVDSSGDGSESGRVRTTINPKSPQDKK